MSVLSSIVILWLWELEWIIIINGSSLSIKPQVINPVSVVLNVHRLIVPRHARVNIRIESVLLNLLQRSNDSLFGI